VDRSGLHLLPGLRLRAPVGVRLPGRRRSGRGHRTSRTDGVTDDNERAKAPLTEGAIADLERIEEAAAGCTVEVIRLADEDLAPVGSGVAVAVGEPGTTGLGRTGRV
jgi:hypothetical protein